jgi:hypothetical protein
MSRASVYFTLGLLPALFACNSSNSTSTELDSITLVSVDPADFPETAQCAQRSDGTFPGGAYVAELIDVSNEPIADNKNDPISDIKGEGGFSVQRSEPIRCGNTVGFAKVVADRSYETTITIYPDIDGNPETVDICTLEGTSVAVVRPKNGKCPKTLGDTPLTLATPSMTVHCSGWAAALGTGGSGGSDSKNSGQSNESGGAGGSGGSTTDKSEIDYPEGQPAVAIDLRTVFTRYCVESTQQKH